MNYLPVRLFLTFMLIAGFVGITEPVHRAFQYQAAGLFVLVGILVPVVWALFTIWSDE